MTSEPGAVSSQQKAVADDRLTADRLLLSAARTLAAARADSPRLTAEALLAYVLGLTRAQLLARREQTLPAEAQGRFAALLDRAAQGEPLAYLTGCREFHCLEFVVDRRVLIPRPETELLVDEALKFLASNERAEKKVLDVGTGSGCIAVTLAVRCPLAAVTALDISEDALDVARLNAERHGVAGRMAFFRSDLLEGLRVLRPDFDLVCANLPYIPTEALASLPVARFEPIRALDGGPDGLLWVRRLLVDLPRALRPGGAALLEIEDTRGAEALALARAAFPEARVELRPDLAGLDRIVKILT